MKAVICIFKGIMNLIYSVFKWVLPVRNKAVIISRQSDEKTLDIELLEQELKKHREIQVVCLCRKIPESLAGKVCYVCHMFTQMYHIATSKVAVIDGYCICISILKQRDSLFVIQMWHALGSLKKFGFSVTGKEEGSSRKLAELMNMHANYDMILTSSSLCASNFAEAFNYPVEKLRVCSLPRVDALTDEEASGKTAELIYDEYPQLREKKTIVYAPTFRKNPDENEAALNSLADAVDRDKYNLVLKAHPLMKTDCCREDMIVDNRFSTIEMFAAADYIILDYSAIVYEAALMEKPLFFYSFDIERYKNNRDFYIDYMEEMPGKISKDAEEIMRSIDDNKYDLDRVKNFADRYVEKQCGCTEELAEIITDKMKSTW